MQIILKHSSMVPIYEQIMGAIKAEIISGDLKGGDPLPSVRVLAAELQISALTVKKAYDRLTEEGFILTVHGKGSFVAETDKGLAKEARRAEAEKELTAALDKVRAAGLSKGEVLELVELLMEDK